MSNLVPFENAPLPAHLAAFAAAADDDLSQGVGIGFPIMSIKGKVWTLTRGKTKEVLLNSEGDPRGSIEVVIIKGNRALSKVYYKDGYKEGSADKPTCYSNDNVAPALDAASPQSAKCETCKHNMWGSRIGDNGMKGKACSDSRRLAIAAPDMLNDPMLLRVPAASLKPLMEYNEGLIKRGAKYPMVVTKLSFDPAAASPKLVFKPVSFVSADQLKQIEETAASSVVHKILGEGLGLVSEAAEDVFEQAAPAAAPKVVAAPVKEAAPAKPAPTVALDEDDDLAKQLRAVLGGDADDE